MQTFDNQPNKSVGKVPWDTFISYLRFYAETYMKQAGDTKRFVIDQYNERVITNLYHWLVRDGQGEFDHNKGIFLCGKIGCGKTILMKAFLETLMAASGFYIPFFQASLIFIHYQNKGIDSLAKCPIFIDELGREQLEMYINGVRVRPIEDLIAMRYEYGATTFFTSNFKIETLSQGYDENGKKQGYGEYIGERLRERNNIVIMPGASRRF